MHDVKENRANNMGVPGRESRDLFMVSPDGLSGRGTTRSLDQDGKDGESCKGGEEGEGSGRVTRIGRVVCEAKVAGVARQGMTKVATVHGGCKDCKGCQGTKDA